MPACSMAESSVWFARQLFKVGHAVILVPLYGRRAFVLRKGIAGRADECIVCLEAKLLIGYIQSQIYCKGALCQLSRVHQLALTLRHLALVYHPVEYHRGHQVGYYPLAGYIRAVRQLYAAYRAVFNVYLCYLGVVPYIAAHVPYGLIKCQRYFMAAEACHPGLLCKICICHEGTIS